MTDRRKNCRIIRVDVQDIVQSYLQRSTQPFTWWQFRQVEGLDPKVVAELEVIDTHFTYDPYGFDVRVYHHSFSEVPDGERTPLLIPHTTRVENVVVNFDRKDTERMNFLQKLVCENGTKAKLMIDLADYRIADQEGFLKGIREIIDIEMAATS